MKKTVFVALAATMFLANSCLFKDNTVVVLPDPETKEQALSIAFDQGQPLQIELPAREVPSNPSTAKPGTLVKLNIVGIDLSESSRYILYINEIETKTWDRSGISGIWTGAFSFNGGVYHLDGVGKIVINGTASITVTPEIPQPDGGAITVPATVASMPAQTTMSASNLCNTWKVTSMYIKVAGGKNKISASNNFIGCNIYTVAEFIKGKGANISDSDLAKLKGYEIDELTFEGNNSVILTFTGKDPYYGSWTMSGDDFTWTLNNSETDVITKVDGTVNWKKSTITLKVNVNSGSETYTGSAQLRVVQANK